MILKMFQDIFENKKFLSPQDLISMASITKIRRIKKGEHLARSGDINYLIVIVVKGLLRHYIIDEEGNEKTMLFVTEKQNSASIETIVRDEVCTENIVAEENSILLSFDHRSAQKVASKSKGLVFLQNQRLKESLYHAVERLRHHTTLSPEERFTLFYAEFPKLGRRVKQKHLASYLGVTPTSLSRMKRRLMP